VLTNSDLVTNWQFDYIIAIFVKVFHVLTNFFNVLYCLFTIFMCSIFFCFEVLFCRAKPHQTFKKVLYCVLSNLKNN